MRTPTEDRLFPKTFRPESLLILRHDRLTSVSDILTADIHLQ